MERGNELRNPLIAHEQGLPMFTASTSDEKTINWVHQPDPDQAAIQEPWPENL
jgi:hypothetical protein